MNSKKQRSELIVGLDVGSTAIRIAVGQLYYRNEEYKDLQILALSEAPAEGVNKGVVSSIEETVSSISNALEKAEKIIGVPIDELWVGISGSHTICQKSRGIVAVAKADGEIGVEDVSRVIEAARTVASPLNYEILHVIPQSFCVDGQTGIKDPIGMTGMRLEVDAQIIQAASGNIKNLTKAVYRTGVDIDDLVLSVLSVGEAVVSKKQKELGVAVVNIGGPTTSLIVYEEGDILHITMLPLGSEHITNDLAMGLRTSIEVAEKVKINSGSCLSTNVQKKEFINLADFGSEGAEEISRKYVTEIIEARMEEILDKVNEELRKIGRSNLLPAGVFFTGGGAKMPGLIELAKEKMRLPANLGFPSNLQGLTDKINDSSFSTAISLVKWGSTFKNGGHNNGISRVKGVDKVAGQVKKWFKSLMP